MEIHSVLPEERARDENNNPLPWGYRYADSSKNVRQPPEESGPFGRNRSIRYAGPSRSSRTRTGTTPIRKIEDPTVAEFSRLFSSQQKEEEELRAKNTLTTTSSSDQPIPKLPAEPVPAQECLLYGYASKAVEWKVLAKYEKISNGHICEDYPRTDPDILHHRPHVVVPPSPLSKDALRKSRTYKGGQHWIKVTFDSYVAAERACFHSPQTIDGHWVYCEMWQGRGPPNDTALVAGHGSGHDVGRQRQLHTLTSSQSTNLLSGQIEASRSKTLPRSATLPDLQYARPDYHSLDDLHAISASSETASSATATDAVPTNKETAASTATGRHSSAEPSTGSSLRSRSVPSLPRPNVQGLMASEYMTAIPSVKRTVLRPISEAVAPQPTLTEKIVRSVPIVKWFFGPNRNATGGEIIGSGPILKEDGSFDQEKNGWYWLFWYKLDDFLGTDFCAIRGDE